MMSSFLSLLKEEPAEGTTDTIVDSNNGSSSCLAMSRNMGHPPPPPPPPTSVNESQLPPGLPMSPIAAATIPMQPPPGMLRSDIDPNFEPIPRVRSNTWPLLPEGFMESEDASGLDPSTSGESLLLLQHQQRGAGGPLGGSSSLDATSSSGGGGGGPPKKNTSRRNPWGNMSYADLIAQAISSSPEGRATLSQIYDWMVQNVPYFKDKGDSNSSAGWKNSIRHNLSLHNRFMRMQNEGTGKSSWWVLNPDAKPGKSTRRRANTLEGNRMEKKRGRVSRKKAEGLRNSIEAPPSPNLGEGIEYFPGSPTTGGPLHHPFQLSPQDYRPRASSNASSCGRLSPIPAIESDMHDSQVPPISPGMGPWGVNDFWSNNNHGHSSHQSHMGRHIHEPYAEHLVESIGESLKLGPREPSWVPHHGLGGGGGASGGGPHNGSSPSSSAGPECLKIPPPPPHHHHHHHHHVNGFIPQPHNQHTTGYGSYDDYSGYLPPNTQCGGAFSLNQPNSAHPKDKSNARIPHFRSFHPSSMQPMSSSHTSHNVSPPNAIGEAHYSSSCEQEMRGNPSYSSAPHTNPSTSHHAPSSTQHHIRTTTASSDQQEQGIDNITTTTATLVSSLSTSSTHHTQQHQQASESTTMLRVALSHRDASCSINGVSHYKQNGVGQLHPLHPVSGTNDLGDLENIQGGLECNVEEVIKHELQYEDHLNFDFHHGQATSSYSHSHAFPHREGSGPQLGGPAGPVQMYSCSSIPSGNHWVR